MSKLSKTDLRFSDAKSGVEILCFVKNAMLNGYPPLRNGTGQREKRGKIKECPEILENLPSLPVSKTPKTTKKIKK